MLVKKIYEKNRPLFTGCGNKLLAIVKAIDGTYWQKSSESEFKSEAINILIIAKGQ